MNHIKIPNYLKKYIVEQNYDRYTYIDHSVWRFIMKISIEFFKKQAHLSYLDGLGKTGISIDYIPRIEDMNKKLKSIGWGAVCVRGFIPPHAFMKFQSLCILPIAADMRTLTHLTYTPSPDIVHEAAGHAPIISDPSYAKYLQAYGLAASKAIMSKHDLDLYNSIRKLSDLKEDENATLNKIKCAEDELKEAYNKIDTISEVGYLARMNWWTVEYGLIGNVQDYKIYGAGLLSSVAESYNCLSKNVKKEPFNLNCINYAYDITEQQPHLFVTDSFDNLTKELKRFEKSMAFNIGGKLGLDKAITADLCCTIVIDNLIQVSGILKNVIYIKNQPIFIQLNGPSQISCNNKELVGHGADYHQLGYSTPIGQIKKIICLNLKLNINNLNNYINSEIEIIYDSGIKLKGCLKNITKNNDCTILLTFSNCSVKYKGKLLFKPDWGNYDLIIGHIVSSVFGGPADIENYENYLPGVDLDNSIMDSKKNYSEQYLYINKLYKDVRKMRESGKINIDFLKNVYMKIVNEENIHWLLLYEILELVKSENSQWVYDIKLYLKQKSNNNSDLSNVIRRGLLLIK